MNHRGTQLDMQDIQDIYDRAIDMVKLANLWDTEEAKVIKVIDSCAFLNDDYYAMDIYKEYREKAFVHALGHVKRYSVRNPAIDFAVRGRFGWDVNGKKVGNKSIKYSAEFIWNGKKFVLHRSAVKGWNRFWGCSHFTSGYSVGRHICLSMQEAFVRAVAMLEMHGIDITTAAIEKALPLNLPIFQIGGTG